jgi:CelD/BcsL family acetyltransferase involved in cellulose biosynthesis
LPLSRCQDAAGDAPRLVQTSWRELEGVAAVAAWNALAARASEPNPFFESWYLLPSLRALDPAGRVRLLIMARGDNWLGLMPVTDETSYYGYPAPHLRNWTHANCFVGAPLVATGEEEAFWRALLEWADRAGGASLFLHVAHLPLSGALHDAFQLVLSGERRLARLAMREERAMLHSSLPAEEYFEASVNAKKRKELKRQARRLAEEGEVAVERETGQANVNAWIADFLALEAAGWKGRAGSALAAEAGTASLFSEALAAAAGAGKLERLSLTLDGRRIAMLATLLSPPAAFSYKTAYDERLARFSPGVLLQRENLALLSRDDIDWCDSCASADHPMIDHLWRERRAIGRYSIAIGGTARRAAFRLLSLAENRGKERLKP